MKQNGKKNQDVHSALSRSLGKCEQGLIEDIRVGPVEGLQVAILMHCVLSRILMSVR